MKICYVAPDVMIPGYSGASTHTLELSRALSKLGNEVHVLCRRGRNEARTEELGGITLHRLYRGMIGLLPLSRDTEGGEAHSRKEGLVSTLHSIYLRTAYPLYSGLEASHLIENFGIEAIIERETAFGAGALASIFTRRPMILELIGPKYSNISVDVCSKVLAYTELMVPARAIPKAIFVSAAVNPELFRPDHDSRQRIRNRYGFREESVVGYVGSFQSWHGIEDLLMAAQASLKSNPRLKFLLVGPNFQKAAAVSENLGITHATVFTGGIPYEEVPSYINACDILVAPYNIENSERKRRGIGSPLKVLEYMACGKAVIGSALPQVCSLIEDHKTGLLFPPGDVTQFADRIIEMVNNELLSAEFGRRARYVAIGRYDWTSLARTFHSILEQTLVD